MNKLKFKMDKRGIATIEIIPFLFFGFITIVLLGIFLFIFLLINSSLDLDVQLGQVNLQDVNNQTFGVFTDAFQNNADNLGIIILLSMVVTMFLNAFFLGSKNKKFFILVDVFILVFVFIIAVYISYSYELLINSSEYLSFYIDDLPKSSKFILQLPLYVSTIGIIMMILSYITIKKPEPAAVQGNVYGYQG